MCIPNNLPLTYKFLPLYGFQDLLVGHEQALFANPSLMGFSFNSASFIRLDMSTLHIFYPWEPCTSPLCSIIGNTPLLSFFPRSFVWVLWARLMQCTNPAPIAKETSPCSICKRALKYTHLILAPAAKVTMITWTLPSLLHTTMSSNTTCWGEKHLREIAWVVNIIHIHIRSILIFSVQLVDTLEIQIVSLFAFIDILKPNFHPKKKGP